MTRTRPHLVLVIPDGVGVRNFLCTSFAERASSAGRLTVWHALPDEALSEHAARLGPTVDWHRLAVRREPLVARVARAGKYFSQLERFPEPGSEPLLVNRNHSLIGRTTHRAGRTLGRAIRRWPALLGTVERVHARSSLGRRAERSPWVRFLREQRPDVVLCTHQRASTAVPAVAAARRLAIPAATFVYSWDNLPKGRMAVRPDHFLVWSEKMAADLSHYYPEVDPARVHVVGTPQFEPHYTPSLRLDRHEFCTAIGIDPARPFVLFSGDDASTSPHDPRYLDDVARAVQAMDAATRPALVFRASPADGTDRYDAVLRSHPEIRSCPPQWRSMDGDGWEQMVPTLADQAMLANLAHHGAVVVNLGSTMALDFALAGKPAVYLAYDQPRTDPHEWSAAEIYRLPHFESVRRTDPVIWAHRREELGPALRRALGDPAAGADAREAWIDAELARPVADAASRCVDTLVGLAGGPG